MIMPPCDTPGGPPCNPQVLGGPRRGPYGPILKDEIPRRYPDFRTFPFPKDTRFPRLPDPYPGPTLPRRSPGERGTYEECQRNQDPGVMHIMDPCQGLPHGEFKLPDLGADSKGYPSMPQGPSVGQELGKLAGMFLGDFIAKRFGK